MIRSTGRRCAALLVSAAASIVVTVVGTGTAAGAAPLGTVLQAGAAGAISGSYIVVLKPGSVAATQVTSASHTLARRYGGAVRRNFLTAVRGFSATLTPTAARRLAADPAVAYVEQDRVVRLAGVQNDPVWGLDRLDQRALPLSGKYTYRSAANVTAYVLDTGVRVSHNEFGDRAVNGWDFIDSDPVANDCDGHGTHVAGTIGGASYGVAKDVTIVGVRVLDCEGSGSYSQIIAGVDWVTTNAVKPAVANMSLGGPASPTLDSAINRSIAAGVTYVLAAGNDDEDACGQSPARTPAAITVGATDNQDARAWFSNYGECLDIFGPGVSITSAGHSSNSSSAGMSGTSMASPHVAGAAALVLGAAPASTPAQVRNQLVNAATTGAVSDRGSGSPNRLLYTGAIGAPAPARCGPFTMGGNVWIGDRATVTSIRKVAGCTGKASSASTVQVTIKHSHRGSLALTLIAPDGSAYPLKASVASDSRNNLVATYSVNAATEARNGTWRLRVRDGYRRNVGFLDSWTLRL